MAKIYIDAGHNASGADTGACGFGIKEQYITALIAVLLRDMLESSDQTVKMSRERITDTVSDTLSGSLSYRYNGANNWGADLFVSIHCNAANTKAYGCETFCYGLSGQGYELAKAVQQHLAAETGLRNRGVKSASFAVISKTKMPAILVETAFIDNYEDNQFLASESGQKACAVAIYKGVCDYLGIGYKLDNIEGGDKLMSREYEELDNRIKKLETGKTIYNYIDKNMPDWAKPTIQKLADKGALQGDGNGLNLTEDLIRQLVINDRMGLYSE